MSASSSKITVDAKTELYGIFGNPVAHTLSPLIHNTMFQALGINAVYLAFEVEKNSIALAFEAMRGMGMRGANLTIPFKEVAIEFIDEIPEDLDRTVGAINTVVNRDGKLFGYNTDTGGFLTALAEELRFNPEGKNILVLGAGGAGLGVISALARAHAERVWVRNRTLERAHSLADTLLTYFPDTDIEAIADFSPLIGERVDLVVNATALGLKENDPSPFDFKHLDNKPCVYDLIYRPAETAFLKKARNLGLASANGLGMLANQAALSFELWTGKKDGVRQKMHEIVKTCSF